MKLRQIYLFRRLIGWREGRTLLVLKTRQEHKVERLRQAIKVAYKMTETFSITNVLYECLVGMSIKVRLYITEINMYLGRWVGTGGYSYW